MQLPHNLLLSATCLPCLQWLNWCLWLTAAVLLLFNSRTCFIYTAIYALPKCNLFPSAASLKSYIPEVFPVQQTKGQCASLPSIWPWKFSILPLRSTSLGLECFILNKGFKTLWPAVLICSGSCVTINTQGSPSLTCYQLSDGSYLAVVGTACMHVHLGVLASGCLAIQCALYIYIWLAFLHSFRCSTLQWTPCQPLSILPDVGHLAVTAFEFNFAVLYILTSCAVKLSNNITLTFQLFNQ